MFPNIEELGCGDLGQVQVRRLLCFICHDDEGDEDAAPLGRRWRSDTGAEKVIEREEKSAANFFSVFSWNKLHTVALRGAPQLFNAGAGAAAVPHGRWGRADSIRPSESASLRACVLSSFVQLYDRTAVDRKMCAEDPDGSTVLLLHQFSFAAAPPWTRCFLIWCARTRRLCSSRSRWRCVQASGSSPVCVRVFTVLIRASH